MALSVTETRPSDAVAAGLAPLALGVVLLLVAFVVRTDSRLTAVRIRAACAASLSPHKIPRRIVFVERLPTNERGKIDRAVLQQMAKSAVS